MINALYTFRAADIARLAAWFLGRTPMATVGNIGVLLIAAVVTAYGTEAMTALLGVYATGPYSLPMCHIASAGCPEYRSARARVILAARSR